MSLKTFHRNAFLFSPDAGVDPIRAHHPARRIGVRFLHVLALAIVTAVSSACGGSGTRNPSEPPDDDEPGTIQPGQTYTGRNGYIEYIAGDLPVILTVSHDGTLTPDELRDRTNGVTDRDLATADVAMEIVNVFVEETGHRPHIIFNRLHRRKLDANREIAEAANGDTLSERAWREFHTFIDSASAIVARNHSRGLILDIHGHGHQIQRLELGYLLYPQHLALPDAELNNASLIAQSSVRALAGNSEISFAELLRGPSSFGALIDERGYDAVPSPAMPDPGSDPYFTGGYITERHGSRAGGTIDAIQIESHYFGLRDTSANRRAFAEAAVAAIQVYLSEHY